MGNQVLANLMYYNTHSERKQTGRTGLLILSLNTLARQIVPMQMVFT